MKNKDIALKCQWVAEIKNNEKIKELSENFLPSIGQDFWLCNLNTKDIKHIMENSFWADVTFAWFHTHWHQPTNPSQVAAQTLWFNSHIRVQNRPVFHLRAYRAGVLCVLNIWNHREKTYLTFQEFVNVYGDCMTYLEYYGLTQAIPKSWLLELQGTPLILEDYIFPYKYFTGKMSKITYDKINQNKGALDALANKWKNKLNCNITYEEFLEHFERLYKLVPDIRMRNFQFQFLHWAIFCAKSLYQWKLADSTLCYLCRREYETIEHLFFDCSYTQRFWEQMVAWYEAKTNTEIYLTKEEVMFCNHEIPIINTLLILAKQFIFTRRIAERPLNIYLFRDRVASIMKIERELAIKYRKCKLFIKKWKILIE